MVELKPARRSDLATVAGWIASPEECSVWAGPSVGYPIDLDRLPDEIQFSQVESWSLFDDEHVAGFGQVIPKPENRQHLARVIVAPDGRGRGLGRHLAQHLLQRALAKSPATVSLKVNVDNTVATELYRSLGFEVAESPDPIDPSHRYMVYAPAG